MYGGWDLYCDFFVLFVVSVIWEYLEMVEMDVLVVDGIFLYLVMNCEGDIGRFMYVSVIEV